MSTDSTPPNTTAVEAVKFTKFGGPLSKEITLDSDGKLASIPRDVRLVSGTAERVRPAGPRALAELIGSCEFNEAIALGTLPTGTPDKVEITTKARLVEHQDAITRTASNIIYRKGEPAVALLDVDVKGMPADVQSRVKAAGGAMAVIESVLPELADTALVVRQSTSSNIVHAETGKEYPGSGGLHIYIYVADGADVERFLKTLHMRMWLAGFGWMIVARNGRLLERSLIDASVASPERLVFEGAPDVQPPLMQRPRVPSVQDGGLLDTRHACPSLTGVKLDQLNVLLAKERQRLKPQVDTVTAAYVGERIKVIRAKRGCSEIADRRMVEREVNGTLLPWAPLEFDDPDLAGATVADVLRDPERYIDETLTDPIEGPQYECGAKVLLRSGSLLINSFAHGGIRYFLKYDADAITKAIPMADEADVVETLVRMLLLADVTQDEEQALVALASRTSSSGVQSIKARIKQARQDAVIVAAKERRERDDADRSDARRVLPVPAPEGEHIPVLRDLDEVLAAVDAPIPPMRDLDGKPLTVTLREPYSLHALTSNGTNGHEDAENRLPPPKLHLLTRHDRFTLGHEIERHIKYVHETPETITPKALPGIFVQSYTAYAASRLPQLAGVVTNPLVLADGTLLADDGLDRQRKLLFLIDPAMHAAIPKLHEVNDDAVKQAMQFLTDDWLCDVLTDYEGKAILIAAALSILQRCLFAERPAYLVTAGRRGGGKTTVVGMVVAGATGARPAAAAWSDDKEERRKAALAAYLEGPAAVVWDNIPRGKSISCPTIEKMLTSETYTDRVLGVSKNATVSTAGVMIFTGNNISAAGDMCSRSLECRLETDQPNPENREFKHLDPVGWTLENRHKLLHAFYTILLGNPQIRQSTKGVTRFRTWWKSVGAAVEHAAALAGGRIDFTQCFMAGESEDAETQSLGGALNALALAAPPGGHFTAAHVKALIDPGDLDSEDSKRDEWAAVMRGYFTADGQGPAGSMSALKIGHRLKAMLGNAVQAGADVLVLKHDTDSHANANSYWVSRNGKIALPNPTQSDLADMMA
jgi:hypothetical protein